MDLRFLFKQLAKREIASVLIEGGATLIGSAIKEKFVDKMHILIATRFLGDQKALSSIQGLNILNLNLATRLKNINIAVLGEDIFIEGYLDY